MKKIIIFLTIIYAPLVNGIPQASVQTIQMLLSNNKLDKMPEWITSDEASQFKYDVNMKEWHSFAIKLKECKKSHYYLPNPIQIAFLKMAIQVASGKKMNGQSYTQKDIDELITTAYHDYVIHGFEQKNCIVTIEANGKSKSSVTGFELSEDMLKELFPITKIKCVFAKEDLPILAKSATQMENAEREESLDKKIGDIIAKGCINQQ